MEMVAPGVGDQGTVFIRMWRKISFLAGFLGLFLGLSICAYGQEIGKTDITLDEAKLKAGKLQIFVKEYSIQGKGVKKRAVGVILIDASPAKVWEVLEDWDKRRNESDLVVKLHTGGGKTLVGLLIAQSILNECHEPVVYLSPTVQLVEQTLSKASEYGILAVSYKKKSDFDDDFIRAFDAPEILD